MQSVLVYVTVCLNLDVIICNSIQLIMLYVTCNATVLVYVTVCLKLDVIICLAYVTVCLNLDVISIL